MAEPKTNIQRALRVASDFVDLQWTLIIRALHKVAPLARGRLLDVGCGDKPYLEIFEARVSEYIGVEHENAFKETATSSRKRGPDVLYDGRELPFEAQSFDTVLCVQVLEHTPAPQHLIRDIARVLRHDGRLILTAPFSFRLHEEPNDYFRYSPHGLRTLCEEAGLEVESCEPMGNLWSLVGHKLNSYLALKVARVGSFAQSIDKLGHESEKRESPRYWAFPAVGASMVGISLMARALDRIAPDETESLAFIIVARHRPISKKAE